MATKCENKCEVYSRVTGYMRPVGSWNKGKQEEFKDRKSYDVPEKTCCCQETAKAKAA